MKIVLNNASVTAVTAALLEKYALIKEVAGDTLEVVAKEIAEDSYNQIPKDTHTASTTVAVLPAKDLGNYTSVDVGYVINGDAYNPKSMALVSEYIHELHENLINNHPNGGNAKFLERPARAHSTHLVADLRAVIKQVL
jgi:hypothetical protein